MNSFKTTVSNEPLHKQTVSMLGKPTVFSVLSFLGDPTLSAYSSATIASIKKQFGPSKRAEKLLLENVKKFKSQNNT